jgi:AraC-like DNA-binding protein
LPAGRTARGVGLARITSSPQTIQRLGNEADAIWLALHLGGDAGLHDGQQTIALAPGDIVFGPAQAQAGLDFRSNFRQFMVSMPRASLKAPLPSGPALALGHISGRAGLGRLFAGTLPALAEAFDTLSDDDIAPVEAALSEFIATSLAAQRDPVAPTVGSSQAATVRRLCAYVDANLSDAALTPSAVAAHEHVSERLVQKLFESLGYFSRAIPPVLRIASGDIVTIETLTQHAYDDHERMIKGDSGAESVFHWTPQQKAVDRRGAGPTDASIYGRGSGKGFGVHICTGPIFVKDAQPGDVLEVRILDLAPRLAANAKYEGRAFGSNAAAWWGLSLRRPHRRTQTARGGDGLRSRLQPGPCLCPRGLQLSLDAAARPERRAARVSPKGRPSPMSPLDHRPIG